MIRIEQHIYFSYLLKVKYEYSHCHYNKLLIMRSFYFTIIYTFPYPMLIIQKPLPQLKVSLLIIILNFIFYKKARDIDLTTFLAFLLLLPYTAFQSLFLESLT